jgi:hypothetical protein
MNEKNYVPAQLPGDVDARLLAWVERLEDDANFKPARGRVTKTGHALRYVLDMADIAESMGIRPEQTPA